MRLPRSAHASAESCCLIGIGIAANDYGQSQVMCVCIPREWACPSLYTQASLSFGLSESGKGCQNVRPSSLCCTQSPLPLNAGAGAQASKIIDRPNRRLRHPDPTPPFTDGALRVIFQLWLFVNVR
ncbi:hypothetical protein GQ54DRAFT_37880 [Martensiomyces pterosporus]|nr:hypothetical protein GQ54DRAFT_37880 [Martensiomyces pterosporus]